jgi:hypothetical protein
MALNYWKKIVICTIVTTNLANMCAYTKVLGYERSSKEELFVLEEHRSKMKEKQSFEAQSNIYVTKSKHLFQN